MGPTWSGSVVLEVGLAGGTGGGEGKGCEGPAMLPGVQANSNSSDTRRDLRQYHVHSVGHLVLVRCHVQRRGWQVALSPCAARDVS